MRKVLKKLCFIAVIFSLFACENEPKEFEYSVTNKLATYDEVFNQELITDMIYSIESDINNIVVNKRQINLKTNDTKTFVVSSSIKKSICSI